MRHPANPNVDEGSPNQFAGKPPPTVRRVLVGQQKKVAASPGGLGFTLLPPSPSQTFWHTPAHTHQRRVQRKGSAVLQWFWLRDTVHHLPHRNPMSLHIRFTSADRIANPMPGTLLPRFSFQVKAAQGGHFQCRRFAWRESKRMAFSIRQDWTMVGMARYRLQCKTTVKTLCPTRKPLTLAASRQSLKFRSEYSAPQPPEKSRSNFVSILRAVFVKSTP